QGTSGLRSRHGGGNASQKSHSDDFKPLAAATVSPRTRYVSLAAAYAGQSAVGACVFANVVQSVTIACDSAAPESPILPSGNVSLPNTNGSSEQWNTPRPCMNGFSSACSKE